MIICKAESARQRRISETRWFHWCASTTMHIWVWTLKSRWIISVNRPRDILKISEFSSVSVGQCSAWMLCKLFVHWMSTWWMESLDSQCCCICLCTLWVCSVMLVIFLIAESFQCPMSPITHSVRCMYTPIASFCGMWCLYIFCSQRLYVSGYQHIPSASTWYV